MKISTWKRDIEQSCTHKELGKTALHLLMEAESMVGIELLLKKGADVMVENKAGCIPLHQEFYNLAILKVLLKSGRDKRAQILKIGWCKAPSMDRETTSVLRHHPLFSPFNFIIARL